MNYVLIALGLLLILPVTGPLIGIQAVGLISWWITALGAGLIFVGVQGLRGKQLFINRRFTNPANGYTETSSSPFSWLWVFLFAPIYFAVRGNWPHAVVSFLLFFITMGVSWFIYPFFTYSINSKQYLRKGWVQA